MSDEDIVAIERRIAFLRADMGREGFSVPDDVITFVASSVKADARTLRGALIRLKAFQLMTPGGAVSVDDARDILRDQLA